MHGEQPDGAEVIAFPTKTKTLTCYDCRNSSVGPPGTYCHVFDEFILSEVLTARDCPAYEEDPDA